MSEFGSAGRGRGFVGGPSSGGGVGRGSFGGGTTTASNGIGGVPPKTNAGFGGVLGSAPAAPPPANDNGWVETPSQAPTKSPGFAGSGDNKAASDGFGGKFNIGFGGSSSGGFGDSNGFRSGGGSRSGGDSGCRKCGEDGHFARECPKSSGSGGGGRGCHKCGQEGHFARECPTGGGGGGGGTACHKCGQEGHFARECPTGGSGGGGRACHKCGEEGHFSRECPKGGSGGGRGCHKCGQEGHFARECPNSGGAGSGGASGSGGFGDASSGSRFGGSSSGDGLGSSGVGRFGSSAGFGGSAGGGGSGPGFGGDSNSGGGSGGFGPSSGFGGGGETSTRGFNEGGAGGTGCRNCGQEGHFAKECPEPKKPQGCHNCGQEGHFSRECPEPKKPHGACHSCGQEGHFSRECPSKPERTGPPPENYVPTDEDENNLFDTIHAGINFDRYDKIPVEMSGREASEPVASFAQANLLDTIHENVKRAQYFKPTPIQKYAIPAIMAGRDLMGCAQTGSGKTAAFLLPVLTSLINRGLHGGQFSPVQEPQAIVVAPTRELVIQIYNECRKFALRTVVRCVRVYGGTSTMHQANDLSKGAHIIIATPGRLMDFIGRGKISCAKVQYLILDEADRMLDMGFEPEIRKLVETTGMPKKTERQTLMFSATFPVEIQKLAGEFLNDYLFLIVGMVGAANEDVTQTITECGTYEKRDKLLELLREDPGKRTLVFVEKKRNADFLASMLSQSEFRTTSIHGDRPQREREQALYDFKSGTAPILVATSVAARGLDIPGVDHVLNYDLPTSIDEYVHRIGRTGRCGNLGKATSFYDADSDRDLARPLVKILGEAHQVVPDFLEQAAKGGYGATGSGSFHSRDMRKGGRSGDFGGWDEQPGGAAPPPPAAAVVEDEESWD